MTELEKIVNELKKIADRLQSEDTPIQVRTDEEAGIIRIYSEKADARKRALAGLHEVAELAYTTAEHHPFWGVLYHAAEISRTTLEKWDGEFSNDELGEIEWRTEEIRNAVQRIRQRSSG